VTADFKGAGGCTDGVYGYMAPYNGKLTRFLLSEFSTNTEELDLIIIDPDLEKFVGCFIDGTYIYLVPHMNAKMARVLLSDFSTVEILDLSLIDDDFKIGVHHYGFWGGFANGAYGYLVPRGPYHAKVVRFLLSDLSTVEVLDLAPISNRLRGFLGGFTDGTYGYLVPYDGGGRASEPRQGKFTRFLLSDFSVDTVEVLDLTLINDRLRGFIGGFTDGTYAYLVPHAGHHGRHGKVARILLSDFSSVEVLDLADTDPDLIGFNGGFTDGVYGYTLPYVGRKIARFLLSDFSTVEVIDLNNFDSESGQIFRMGFTDGNYGYTVPWTGRVYRFPVVPHMQGIGWSSSQ